MTRRALALVALSLTFLIPARVMATGVPADYPTALAVRDGVAVRSAPSRHARIIATLIQQSQVELLGQRGSWAHVKIWDTVSGWTERRELTNRREWSTISHYRAPVIKQAIRQFGPASVETAARSSAVVPLYRELGGPPVGKIAAGISLTVTGWQQDGSGRVWYRVEGKWAPADGISFAPRAIAHAPRSAPIWAPVAGKGMWLTLGATTGIPPSVLVAAAHDNGVSHLYLEAAISPLGFHGRNSVGPLIDAAHRRHIAVIAWVFPYLDDIAADVALTRRVAAFRTARGESFDGIAADLERHITPATVRSYSQLIRYYLGARYLLVGVTYPPQSFPDYPFREMALRYSVLAPMDYWHQTNTAYGLNYGHMAYGFAYGYHYALDSIRAIRAAGGTIPIAPIGQTFDNYGRLEMGPYAPSGSEVRGFLEGCRQAGAIGASFFQWMTATQDEWAAIHNFHF